MPSPSAGVDLELDFGGRAIIESFLMLLFTIGNIAVWGTMAPRPPGSAPVPVDFKGATLLLRDTMVETTALLHESQIFMHF